jgi:hypothetical protein
MTNAISNTVESSERMSDNVSLNPKKGQVFDILADILQGCDSEEDAQDYDDIGNSPVNTISSGASTCRREDADTRPFEQWSEQLADYMLRHFKPDYDRARKIYEEKSRPSEKGARNPYNIHVRQVNRTTTVKTTVFPLY